MRICAISDVHSKWKKLQIPGCDILISAGDYSFRGEQHMVRDFHAWMSAQPARHIISVQGNHELWVEANFQLAKDIALKACPRVHFIDHGLVEVDGVKIFGSAWTPWFYNWAWNARRTLTEASALGGPWIKNFWDQIPDGIDVLVTHGPPYGILDEVVLPDGSSYDPPRLVGCEELLHAIKRVKPQVHIFGHIHCGSGEKHVDGVSYYNAAICDEMYMPTNPVRVIDL